MTALAIKNDDFGQYREETKMLIERFCDGSLHAENSEQYFNMASTICRHFENNVSGIDKDLNQIQTDCFNTQEVQNNLIDEAAEYFEAFEAFAEHICKDFKDFSEKLYKVVPKAELPQKLRVRMNLLENRIEFLQSKVSQTENDVTTILFSLASPDVLRSRAV